MRKEMKLEDLSKTAKMHKIEIAIFIIFMIIWFFAWHGVNPKSLGEKERTLTLYTSYEERALAADAVKTAITGTLTASSIILAACAAAIGLYSNRQQLPDDAKQNFKSAAAFGLVSVFFAALNLAYLPAQVNTVNIATVKSINLFAVLQLMFMVFSAARLMLAIRKLF
jgi:hypothetical protein